MCLLSACRKRSPWGDLFCGIEGEKESVVSATDLESGVFHKGEHKKCFAYEAHTACDKHNFILGVHVTP